MTDHDHDRADEELPAPTFSHQPPPAPSTEPAARTASDFMALAKLAEPAFEDSDDGRTARTLFLRGVWETLPDNLRARRAELEQRAHERMRSVANGWWFDGPNLLILGPTGVGKTSGAALIVRRLIEDAIRTPVAFERDARRHWRGCGSSFELAGLIRWQGCRELSTAMREHPLGQGTPEAIARCQNARLLVLDDIGGSDDPGALERVLNARYERGWPTITTSGLSTRDLAATFGDAMVRRMLQRRGRDGLVVSLFERSRA